MEEGIVPGSETISMVQDKLWCSSSKLNKINSVDILFKFVYKGQLLGDLHPGAIPIQDSISFALKKDYQVNSDASSSEPLISYFGGRTKCM